MMAQSLVQRQVRCLGMLSLAYPLCSIDVSWI